VSVPGLPEGVDLGALLAEFVATEIPAAILARTLGISVNSAVRWQQISAGDWAGYAADVSNRSRPQRADPTETTDYVR
jgi:hypothetical protein